MGFFSRLGSRISSGLHSAARLGKKALGSVSRVGNTIAHGAEKVVNVVDRIPIVGQVLSPLSGVVRSGIGLVKDVAYAAGAGKKLLSQGEDLLSAGESALKNKDLSAVGDLAKQAQGVGKFGKSQLERSKKIVSGSKALVSDAKKVSVRDMARSGVNQARMSMRNM